MKSIPLAVNISVTLIFAILLTVLTGLTVDYFEKPFKLVCDYQPCPLLPNTICEPSCTQQYESIGGISPNIVFFSAIMIVGVGIYLLGLFVSRVQILGSSLLVSSLGIVSVGIFKYFGNLDELFRIGIIAFIAIIVLFTALFKFKIIGAR